VGPIDGHNLDHLLPILKNVRDVETPGPILVHVVTQKGKGYRPAEQSADKFHGVSSFNVETGTQIKSSPSAPSFTKVFARSLIAEARRDDRICAITAAMPSGTGVDMFGKEFPDRTFDVGIAERLFAELRESTSDTRGVTRASYGRGETTAHDIIRREAHAMGLRVESDPALNLYVTLEGHDSSNSVMIGSHLDSVPRGGNFDGAAGVLMGMSIISGLCKSEVKPPKDITVMAIRAEESAWFNASFIGSRAAFGLLDPGELDSVVRSDDGRTLGTAIRTAGGQPGALQRGDTFLDPASIGMFLEPHIEQGPVLVRRGLPFGIATAIRGSIRYREARCLGEYAHSGAAPRSVRRDAVLATARLVVELDELWTRYHETGRDLAVTVGQVSTDERESAVSKVAGLTRIGIELRSRSTETLSRADAELRRIAGKMENEYCVKFSLGPETGTQPSPMSAGVIAALSNAAGTLGIDTCTMPCGAAHDASVFQSMGVPTGMILIRNENGSHNPDEDMNLDDFALAANVLMELCLRPSEMAGWPTA